MDSQAIAEAKNDVVAFAKLEDDDRTIFIINKMREFTNRFGVGNSTNYSMEYFKALSKELNKQ